jgi:hypothetical protein
MFICSNVQDVSVYVTSNYIFFYFCVINLQNSMIALCWEKKGWHVYENVFEYMCRVLNAHVWVKCSPGTALSVQDKIEHVLCGNLVSTTGKQLLLFLLKQK